MQDSDELVAVDLASQALTWRVKTGPMPADVFGTPDGKTVLVGMTGRRLGRGVRRERQGSQARQDASRPARAPMHSAPRATGATCT